MRFLAAVLLASPVPAAAQLRPVEPISIAAAIRDCTVAATPSSVDTAVLERAGWQAARMGTANGTVRTPLRFYGKGAEAPVIMLSSQGEAAKLCIVTARVASSNVVLQVRTDLLEAFPGQLVRQEGQEQTYISGPLLFQFGSTGTSDAPAVRIVVGRYQ